MFVLVLMGLAHHVRTNWDKLPELTPPDFRWLLLSAVFGYGAMFLVPLILRKILSRHGCPVSLRGAVALYFVPLQGKYIPGKVWSMVWAMACYRSVGANWPTALSCLVVLTLLNLISSLLVAIGFGNAIFDFPWYIGLLALTLLLALEPRIFRRGVNFALRRAGKEPVHNTLDGPILCKLMVVNMLYWLLFGLGYWALARSIFPAADIQVAHFMSAQAGAFLLALLAFFAPAGLGVREGILAGLLTPLVGIGPAIVLAIAQRLWQISLEVPYALLGLYFLRKLEPSMETE